MKERPAPRRRRTRAGGRADSAMPVEEDQLVEESVARRVPPPPPLGAPKRASLALQEQSVGLLGDLRSITDEFRYPVVAAGAGVEGVTRVIAAMRGDPAPAIVLVAIPGGEEVIDAARRLEPRRPVVVITGPGSVEDLDAQAGALGADLFAVRPHEPAHLVPVLAAAARMAQEREELVAAKGAQRVLRHRLDQMVRPSAESRGLHPFEVFRRVLELELKRTKRYGYPLSVCLLELIAAALPSGGDRILRARATAAVTSSIRDIDLVTELEDGRYLVLLPYTDLTGAAQVAARLVRAVAAQPAVAIGGIATSGTLRVGVAGARSGQPLSFARLMKDASAALQQAKKDEAELVVWTGLS